MKIKNPSQIASYSVAKSIMQLTNPFWITNDDKTFMQFKVPTDCYFQLMVIVWNEYRRAYIEIPLLLTRLYRFYSYADCVSIASRFKPMGLDTIACFEWGSKESKQFMHQLMMCLCNLCETTFVNDYFENAWNKFIYRIQLENSKDNDKKRK